ncbi:hypothetical protein BKA69DRAFT_1051583 [Paraphysoderma sedebokerense]|nr:hypothetical protein BKA69DRAFT_1051583 [Paraphysoderma sedebokerense]
MSSHTTAIPPVPKEFKRSRSLPSEHCPTIISGYLRILSKTRIFGNKRWKRRYFVFDVNEGTIKYFRTQEELKEPKAVIRLNSSTLVQRRNGNEVLGPNWIFEVTSSSDRGVECWKKPGSKHCSIVYTTAVILESANPEEFQIWFNGLKQFIENKKENGNRVTSVLCSSPPVSIGISLTSFMDIDTNPTARASNYSSNSDSSTASNCTSSTSTFLSVPHSKPRTSRPSSILSVSSTASYIYVSNQLLSSSFPESNPSQTFTRSHKKSNSYYKPAVIAGQNSNPEETPSPTAPVLSRSRSFSHRDPIRPSGLTLPSSQITISAQELMSPPSAHELNSSTTTIPTRHHPKSLYFPSCPSQNPQMPSPPASPMELDYPHGNDKYDETKQILQQEKELLEIELKKLVAHKMYGQSSLSGNVKIGNEREEDTLQIICDYIC